MAKKQLERFTVTRRIVRSRGKVTSERYRRRLRTNDQAAREINNFWNGVPLEPPDHAEQEEAE